MLALELVLRISGVGLGESPLNPDDTLHHAHPRNYEFTRMHAMSGNEFGGFKIRYDSEGRTADPAAERSFDRNRCTRTVVLLGDSFTEAGQVAYRDSFAGRLQSAARENVCFLNYGVASYSPVLYWIQYNQVISAQKPTHVIILLYGNDIRDDARYFSAADKDERGLAVRVSGGRVNKITTILRSLYSARLINHGWNSVEYVIETYSTRHSDFGRSSLEEAPNISGPTETHLLALINRIRSDGSEALLSAVPSKVLMTQTPVAPSRFPTPRTFATNVKEWSKINRIDYVDLESAFLNVRSKSAIDLFYTRDIHTNSNGHELMAAVFAGHLASLIDFSKKQWRTDFLSDVKQ